MRRFDLFVTPLFILGLLVATPVRANDDTRPSLADLLENWIKSVEKDDLKSAKQLAATPETAAKLEKLWPQVRECHKQYDYRRWIERAPDGGAGANAVGGATAFTVGGHSFGHVHVTWEKSDAGWRVSDVFMCR